MAIFKFYNIQLLPMNKKIDEVGDEGYCKLFNAIKTQINETKEKGHRLSSMAIKMKGEMFFAPYSVTIKEYASDDAKKPNKVVHGYFLKFDDVNELVDTDSGELEYRSKGNTSSKRLELEFVFDPKNHILAIHDAKGLPSRVPLIDALDRVLSGAAHALYPEHNLDIDELTAADSIEEFFAKPKKGFKNYTGTVTFSNSDDFEEIIEPELRPLVAKAELELKDKSVGKWIMRYQSFKDHLMSDLPINAKVQMMLATQYGNAESSYTDEEGKDKKYQMEDYPVREPLEGNPEGILDRTLSILGLIRKAKTRTRASKSILEQNRVFLTSNESNQQ